MSVQCAYSEWEKGRFVLARTRLRAHALQKLWGLRTTFKYCTPIWCLASIGLTIQQIWIIKPIDSRVNFRLLQDLKVMLRKLDSSCKISSCEIFFSQNFLLLAKSSSRKVSRENSSSRVKSFHCGTFGGWWVVGDGGGGFGCVRCNACQPRKGCTPRGTILFFFWFFSFNNSLQ